MLCTLTAEAKRIDDPRYQFDTEEKDGVVVKCTINNAEVLDVPGVVYRLHPNETEKNRLDSLEVLIRIIPRDSVRYSGSCRMASLKRMLQVSELPLWPWMRKIIVS